MRLVAQNRGGRVSEIEARVTGFIVENFLFGDSTRLPGAEDSLTRTGVMDSTGVLELIEFLEAEFSLVIREDDTIPENLDSVARIARFVRSRDRTSEPPA